MMRQRTSSHEAVHRACWPPVFPHAAFDHFRGACLVQARRLSREMPWPRRSTPASLTGWWPPSTRRSTAWVRAGWRRGGGQGGSSGDGVSDARRVCVCSVRPPSRRSAAWVGGAWCRLYVRLHATSIPGNRRRWPCHPAAHSLPQAAAVAAPTRGASASWTFMASSHSTSTPLSRCSKQQK